MQIPFVIRGIVLSGLVAGASCNAQETFNLCASILVQPFSGTYLALADGHEFTFNQIAGDQFPVASTAVESSVLTQFDDAGNLIALHDGRHKPLVLGSMPRKSEYVAQLRQAFNLNGTARVGIYSLNHLFELACTGAGSMAEGEADVTLFMHPTTDECAPSLPDILRIVRDLRARDGSGHDLSYVHCLAGRGRSATAVAAYILCLLKQENNVPEVDVIERYLQSRRRQVGFSGLQKRFLNEFRNKLSISSFEALYAEHEDAIGARDAACAYHVMAPVLRDHADLYTNLKVGALLAATVAVGVGYTMVSQRTL